MANITLPYGRGKVLAEIPDERLAGVLPVSYTHLIDCRLQIVNGLIDAGLTKIEVGTFAHPGYMPQFKHIEELIEKLPRRNGVEYTFLALNQKAVERAVEMKAKGAPIDRVLTGQLATSAAYARKNMNRSQ